MDTIALIAEDKVIDIVTVKQMSALQYINSLKPAIPMSRENPCTQASGSEIRRWLQQKSIRINNSFPKPTDIVDFPVRDLVFFPKSDRSRTTIV